MIKVKLSPEEINNVLSQKRMTRNAIYFVVIPFIPAVSVIFYAIIVYGADLTATQFLFIKVQFWIVSWLVAKHWSAVRLLQRAGYKPIQKPPLYRSNRLVWFLFSKKVYQRVFTPVIADVQEEYFEAIQAKEISKARWIKIRGGIQICVVALYQALESLAALVTQINKISK